MKKVNRRHRKSERDTMRPEYDFSAGVRGATAARYAQGPTIVRQQRRAGSKRKSA